VFSKKKNWCLPFALCFAVFLFAKRNSYTSVAAEKNAAGYWVTS
jgi:hypothetical protein